MPFSQIQFAFMPEKVQIDTVFVLGKLHKEYHAEGDMLCVCFVDLEKSFD